MSRINAIETRGKSTEDRWVSKYYISTSKAGVVFTDFVQNGTRTVFSGNYDRDTVVTNTLTSPIEALYLRITIVDYNIIPALRFEVRGEIIDEPLRYPIVSGSNGVPDSYITASSSSSANWGPSKGRLLNTEHIYGSWVPQGTSDQWIQVAFRKRAKVYAVQTRGRIDRDEWVTKYKISTSSDGVNFQEYREDGKVKIFPANYDRTTIITNVFKTPVDAAHLRVIHVEHHGHIALRFEVIGTLRDARVKRYLVRNVEYNLNDLDTTTQPVTSMSSITIDNYSSSPQTATETLTTSYTREQSWNNDLTVSASVETTIQTGFVKIVEGQISVSASTSYTHQWGGSVSKTEEKTFTREVTVPPMRIMKVTMAGRQYSATIKYTADLVTYYVDNTTSLKKITGTYTGVLVSDFRIGYREYKLEDEYDWSKCCECDTCNATANAIGYNGRNCRSNAGRNTGAVILLAVSIIVLAHLKCC